MADIREARLQSLMEVIHAVLLSLEEYRGGASIHDDWNRVVAGLQNRLASATSWRGAGELPPLEAFPDAAEHILDPPRTGSLSSSRRPTPEPSRPAPSDSGELNTVELFLRRGAAESEASPPSPASAAPPAPNAPASIPLDLARSEELDRARQEVRLQSERAEAARAESSRLRMECEDLRRRLESAEAQARELARGASAGARPPSDPGPAVADSPRPPAPPAAARTGVSPSAILRALDIRDTTAVNEPALAAQIAALSRYLEKTRGNLVHIFQALEIPVRIPPFTEVIRVSLASGADGQAATRHLEQLRNCWKVLVSGTWNHLEAACGRVQESLDPEAIERDAKARRTKPWDAYQEQFRRLPIYSVIVEALRIQIRAGLSDPRSGAPDFI